MMTRKKRLPVLVLDRRSITVVEPGYERSNPSVPAIFAFSDGLDWSTPVELAEAFRAFCSQRRIKVCRVAAATVPAEWTAVRKLTFPPVDDPSLLPAMVAIAAEKAFAERAEDLTWAYEVASSGEGCEVSLFACLRSRVSEVESFVAAAGLPRMPLTPLVVAATAGCDLPEGAGVVVFQRLAGAEIVSVVDGRVQSLRSVFHDGEDAQAAWAAAAAAIAPLADGTLRVLGDEELIRLAERAFGVTASAVDGSPPGPDAPLVAAARAAGDGRLGVDLLASAGARMTLKWTALLRRVALVVVAVACVGGWFALDWRSASVRAATAEARLVAVAERADQARRYAEFLSATSTWAENEPHRLAVLKALTAEFPAEGVIWLTGLHLDVDGAITLSGKASDRGEVLALFDRLRASEAFDAVTPHYVRQQTGGDRDVSFVVACMCVKGVER